jgi:hypothetical protein
MMKYEKIKRNEGAVNLGEITQPCESVLLHCALQLLVRPLCLPHHLAVAVVA